MDERDTSSDKAEAAGEAIVEEPFDPAESDDKGQNGGAGEGGGAGHDAAAPAESSEAPLEGQGPASEPKEEPAEPTLEERLVEARAAGERMRQQMLRIAADFDNFRKRAVRDLDDARRRARQGVIRDFLPVFDNLERATDHAGDTPDPVAFADGIRIVLKQFDDTLRRLGIDRIDAVGAAFDPTLHESIQLVESAEHEVGTVVTMIQPGYKHGEELLRPALVAVSKGPPAAPPEEPAPDGDGDAAGEEPTPPQESGPEAVGAPPAAPAESEGEPPGPSATNSERPPADGDDSKGDGKPDGNVGA